ncbi:unnamed protein product [Peniophora sp. CBMAI 1063]|nr:unnamed protein product [Peniophora sp. CBMAI 1063]
MAHSMPERRSHALRLPPELLDHIFSYIPYERASVRIHQKIEPRSFKTQLAFAHVCRAWRSIALASDYWPGLRLPLQDDRRPGKALVHDSGNSLLYVHVDMDQFQSPRHTVNEKMKDITLRALNQLPRIRTLFLRLDPDDDYMTFWEKYDDESDAWEFAHALGEQDAPELQDLTLGWMSKEHLRLDFIEHPFPRLRYLSLMRCTWETRSRTLFQTDNLVHANFWDVRLCLSVDELVDTFLQWKRLQYLNIMGCNLMSGTLGPTTYNRRAAYLPELKEIEFSGEAKDIGTFMTYVAFPPSTSTRLSLRSMYDARDTSSALKDAIHDHFDIPQGRSLIKDSHSFVIAYPTGFEIQSYAPENSPPFFWRHMDNRPESQFILRGFGSQAGFLSDVLSHVPALEHVSRLDLGQSAAPRVRPPPIQLLRRFVAVTELIINTDWRHVLDAMLLDSALFPELECVQLFDFDLRDQSTTTPLRNVLDKVRKGRANLVRLTLRECYMGDEAFKSVFGDDNVLIKSSDEESEDDHYY